MADLISGMYPQKHAFQGAVYGLAGNFTTSSSAVRSNAEYLGMGSVAQPGFTSNKLSFVPIPVDNGVTYSQVSFIAGTTAPTLTINYAAVYSGQPTAANATLLAQSTNAGSTAPTISTVNTYTLTTPVTANAVNAPYGSWYVGIQQTGTVNNCLSAAFRAQVISMNSTLFPNAPIFWSGQVAATTGTAPSTLTGAVGSTVGVPFMFLT